MRSSSVYAVYNAALLHNINFDKDAFYSCFEFLVYPSEFTVCPISRKMTNYSGFESLQNI